MRGVDQLADAQRTTAPWGSRAAVAVPAFGPHAALAGAAALCALCEVLVVDTGHGYWLAVAAAFATAALVFAWRRQDELRFAPILAIAAAYQLAVVAAHVAGDVLGDQDVAAYAVYGSEVVDGRFPQTEYPAGAVLLFGLEALLGKRLCDHAEPALDGALSAALRRWCVGAAHTP